ncbi:MAG: cell cycle protein [Bryobacterales bacterium]|nr:cell cycle protein [Bryobacterales bacterium]
MTVMVMVLFGFIMVYSASSVVAEVKRGTSYYYAVRQLIWIAAAMPALMFFKRLHYSKLQTPSVAFTLMGGVFILLIAAYFLDPAQHRWIRFPGIGGIQPAEIAKPAVALFLAYFIALRSRAINSRYTLVPAILAVGFITMAVVVADLGTPIVIVLTATAVFCVAGIEWRYIGLALVVGVLAGGVAVAAKPYRLVRVIHFVDPQLKLVDKFDTRGWIRTQMKRSVTAKDTNYQIEQSKIAVGSGGLAGVGLMEGRQKLFYLPESHTDMIFAVVGEEWGFIGAMGVMAGFVIILWRGIRATALMQDEFGRYLALGITTMLVIQAFFNISVALGMVPPKGIPLPMISFGGSSLLVTVASLGILMNISEHAG